MATQTTVLDLTKPAGNENALISVINGNMDKVDAEAGKVRGNVAATYSSSSAYAVGDLCIHDGNLYSCNTAIGSGGEDWTAAHWTQTAIADEIPEVVDNLTTTSSTKALSAGQGKSLADQIANNNLITTDLSYTDCTYSEGGYVVIGALVILMLSVYVTTGSSSVKAYVTLPSDIAPKYGCPLSAVNISDDTIVYCVTGGTNNKSVYLKGATTNKTHKIIGVWVKK